MAFSTEEKVGLLLKKNLGKPSTDTSLEFYSEPSIDSRPKVFTSQIFADDIPNPCPTNGWSNQGGSLPGDLGPGDTATQGVLKYYHKWPMQVVTAGNPMSFRVVSESNGPENPLQNSVPFNYDPSGGYGILLFRNNGSQSPGAQIYDGTGEWVVDPDSGVLTFYQYESVRLYVDQDNPPFVSFFRYTGAIGLPSASPWTANLQGIYYNQPNKSVMIGRHTSSGPYDIEVQNDIKVHGYVLAHEFQMESDRRLKKNIEEVENPLEKLRALRGVRFEWKKSSKTSYGVIADEIEAILPESTSTGSGGFSSVNYNAVIALLIEAVKKQDRIIQQLLSASR